MISYMNKVKLLPSHSSQTGICKVAQMFWALLGRSTLSSTLILPFLKKWLRKTYKINSRIRSLKVVRSKLAQKSLNLVLDSTDRAPMNLWMTSLMKAQWIYLAKTQLLRSKRTWLKLKLVSIEWPERSRIKCHAYPSTKLNIFVTIQSIWGIGVSISQWLFR